MKSYLLVFGITVTLLSGCASEDSSKIKDLEEKIEELQKNQSPSPSNSNGDTKSTEIFKINVTIKQSSTNYYYSTEEEARSEGCYGTDGINDGTSLRVLNASGTVIGLSKLRLRIYDLQPPDESSDDWVTWCEGYTTVEVPKTSIYQVKVGLRNAGEYTFAELTADKWNLKLQG